MNTNASQDSCLVSIGQAFAWLVASILAIISGLYLREAILSIASLFQAAQYQVYRQKGGLGLDFQTGYMISFLDNVVLLTLGITIIAAVIAIEYYLRKGRAKGLLLKRIGIVAGIEVAIILVSILIRTVI